MGAAVIIACIILFFSFFIFRFLLKELKREEYRNAVEILNTEAVKVELYLESIDNVSKKIATSQCLQKTLSDSVQRLGIQQFREIEEVVQNSVIFTNADKMKIFIWDDQKRMRYYSHASVGEDSLFLEKIDKIMQDDAYCWFVTENRNNMPGLDRSRMSVIRRIYNVSKGTNQGYVEIVVDRDSIDDIFGVQEKVCLYNEQGEIYYPYETINEMILNCLGMDRDIVGEDMVFLKKPILNNRMYVAVYYDSRQIFQSFKSWRNVSIGLILCVLLGAVLVVSFYTKVQLAPLERLRRDMKRIEYLNSVGQIKSEDYEQEFKVFVETFNELLEKIEIGRRKELIAMKQIEKAKYEALQAQISPHFIQNILFDLQIMITSGETDLAYDICGKLSMLLRYIMEIKKMTVPLERELEYVKNYLELYQIQYETDFHYEIISDADTDRIIVPKLSIQPFVENSIKHGLYDVPYAWEISVACKKHEKGISIEICDNGCGMDDDEIRFIMNHVTNIGNLEMEQDDKKILGIGMINTLCRWKYLYGEDTHIRITRRNPGLKIEIMISDVQEYTHNTSV